VWAARAERFGTAVVDIELDSLLPGHRHRVLVGALADILDHLEENVVGGLVDVLRARDIRGQVGGIPEKDSRPGLEVLLEVDHTGPDVREEADCIDLEEGGRRSPGWVVGGTEPADGPEEHRRKGMEVLYKRKLLAHQVTNSKKQLRQGNGGSSRFCGG
jgi:hypothetical protein